MLELGSDTGEAKQLGEQDDLKFVVEDDTKATDDDEECLIAGDVGPSLELLVEQEHRCLSNESQQANPVDDPKSNQEELKIVPLEILLLVVSPNHVSKTGCFENAEQSIRCPYQIGIFILQFGHKTGNENNQPDDGEWHRE